MEEVKFKLANGHREDLYLMANCRRLVARKWTSSPNWVLAAELFATGSKPAWKICVDAGIDPESTKIDVNAASAAIKIRDGK